jgi:hypothetical protein
MTPLEIQHSLEQVRQRRVAADPSLVVILFKDNERHVALSWSLVLKSDCLEYIPVHCKDSSRSIEVPLSAIESLLPYNDPLPVAQEETELMNRVLLGTYLTLKSRPFVEDLSQSLRMLLRTGKLGACSGCPWDENGVYPERCEHTARYDHAIYRTSGGKFYYHTREIPREELLAALQ